MLATTATVTQTPVVPTGRYRAAGVLRSEWTKLRSVRSSTWTLAALVGLTVLIGALTFVTVVVIVPEIVRLLPSSIGEAVGKYLPFNMSMNLTSVHHPANQLSPWVGFGVLCAWAASALAVGGWLMMRRDA